MTATGQDLNLILRVSFELNLRRDVPFDLRLVEKRLAQLRGVTPASMENFAADSDFQTSARENETRLVGQLAVTS